MWPKAPVAQGHVIDLTVHKGSATKSSVREVLLIRYVLIDRDNHVEPSGLGGIEQAAILEPCKVGESRRLAVVSRE
jgi:hypothetical protein